MNIAYIRVSTVEQNEARQVEAMEKYQIEKWYTEKISAKDMNRPKLQEMLEFCREGDTIHIHDLSRLARSTKDLLEILENLQRKGVALVSNKESIDTSTPTGKLIITMVAAINEFERQNLLDRQREGIQIAKRQGKYKGGKLKHIPHFAEHYKRLVNKQISKAALARELNISRPTLDRHIKDYEGKAKTAYS